MRWLGFSFGAALLCQSFDLLDRPFWVLAAAFFLLWFIGETLYNWPGDFGAERQPDARFSRATSSIKAARNGRSSRAFLKSGTGCESRASRQAQALNGRDRRREFTARINLSGRGRDHPGADHVPAAGQRNDRGCYGLTTMTADGKVDRDRQPLHPVRGLLSGELVRRPQALAPVLARLLAHSSARGLAAAGELARVYRGAGGGTKRDAERIGQAQHRTRIPFTARPTAKSWARSPRPADTASGRKSGC